MFVTEPEQIVGRELIDIYEKVTNGKRLTIEDGVRLAKHPDLSAVGYLANIVRERINGNVTYFIRNQHINYTNICNKFCKFCCFYSKKDGGPEPYEYSREEVMNRVRWHIDEPITEIHMVGGVNPRLPYEYYMDIIRGIKEVRPDVYVKAFTTVELVQIAEVGKVSITQALKDLREAGLDSPTGGGIEILSDRVHQELFDRKLDGSQWKEISREVAKAGLPHYATMLYGHIETIEERIDHLVQLRELQDETGHILAMTPLSFKPESTELEHLHGPTGELDLRMLALCRLMLDNIDHIKSFWIMNTPEITQIAQWYGADDADGTVFEYEITYEDGKFGDKKQVLTYPNMLKMIRAAGRVPVERDSLYNILDRPGKEIEVNQKSRLTPLPTI